MFTRETPHPELQALMPQVIHTQFKRGEIILRPYDETKHVYEISKGLIKAYTINKAGEESINLVYGPGNLFPLTWIYNSNHRPIFFEALTDCEVALVDKDLFMEHVKNNAALSDALVRKILDLFTVYASRVSNLELKFGRERLAYRLLVLAARFGVKQKGRYTLPSISQHDLGTMINVSREGVSKEMSRFERLGIVNYTANHIVILDSKKLHHELGDDVYVAYFDGDEMM